MSIDLLDYPRSSCCESPGPMQAGFVRCDNSLSGPCQKSSPPDSANAISLPQRVALMLLLCGGMVSLAEIILLISVDHTATLNQFWVFPAHLANIARYWNHSSFIGYQTILPGVGWSLYGAYACIMLSIRRRSAFETHFAILFVVLLVNLLCAGPEFTGIFFN